jgi:hypothetical protein
MKWKEPNTGSSLVIITLFTLACLLPFVGKAFHIDDPLFVWTARQIQSHPLNFYGFNVNWNGWVEPMAAVTKNPPLAAYYMAAAGALSGWTEIALHAWFLLPALALAVGTWSLARNFCSHPLVAALMAGSAPVFLLSSTSIMCDTMMLAFWVWAIVFWMAGLSKNSWARLCVAALLISASELTKYFGLCLIPLLLVYSLMLRRQPGAGLAWLLFPALVLVLYQWLTRQLYGTGLLFSAAAYATRLRMGGGPLEKILTGLAFCGGCMVILVFLAPLLWGWKGAAGGLLAAVLAGLLVVAMKKVDTFTVMADGRIRWAFVVQFSCLIVAGTSLIFLAAADWLKHKTPPSMLLLLWVAGTFLFACAVNWTVSGRNILPMLPAVCILLVRRLENRKALSGRVWAPVGLSLGIALLVAWADYRQAAVARATAETIVAKVETNPANIWFDGHWGFQYYMQEQGARPLNRDHLRLFAHDIVVVPEEKTTYTISLSPQHVVPWFKYIGDNLPWLTTMSLASGAGYYSDGWGPMPFVFCHTPPEAYLVNRIQ